MHPVTDAHVPKDKGDAIEKAPSVNSDDNNPNANTTFPIDIDNGYGESIQDMEDCYLNAPAEAKDIVALLKDPTHFVKTYRFALMVSKPGDGKTLLSKAIAYKAGWKLAFFPSSAFAGTARNETLKNMLTTLNWIVENRIKTVASIDEINRLAENTKNTNYDTAETATALCNFFDAHKFNPNLYVIGTMNEITKIPKLFKQRAEGRIIYFQPLPLESKKRIIKRKIMDAGWTFHQRDTDTILDQSIDRLLDGILQEIPDWNARDMEAIANVAVTLALRSNNYQLAGSIGEQHFQDALEKIRLDRETSDYNREEESREEQELRLRKEDRKLNKKLNKKNRKQTKKLHKDQAKRQEIHQLQTIQTTVEMGTNQFHASLFGFGASNIGRKDATVYKLMSPVQIILYRQSKTETRIAAERHADDAIARLNALQNPEELAAAERNATEAFRLEKEALAAEQEALNVEAEKLSPAERSEDWLALKNHETVLRNRRRAEIRAYNERALNANARGQTPSAAGTARRPWVPYRNI